MALVEYPVRIKIASSGTENEGYIGIIGVVEFSDCQERGPGMGGGRRSQVDRSGRVYGF